LLAAVGLSTFNLLTTSGATTKATASLMVTSCLLATSIYYDCGRLVAGALAKCW